jgi:hypothetical protein
MPQTFVVSEKMMALLYVVSMTTDYFSCRSQNQKDFQITLSLNKKRYTFTLRLGERLSARAQKTLQLFFNEAKLPHDLGQSLSTLFPPPNESPATSRPRPLAKLKPSTRQDATGRKHRRDDEANAEHWATTRKAADLQLPPLHHKPLPRLQKTT